MAAHYQSQLVNYEEMSRSLELTGKTIRHYLDILSDTFMVRLLPPWWENLGKRLVKSPKFYIRDSGLFHALMGLKHMDNLRAHPKLGASWEGFALEQTLALHGRDADAFFWATYSGAEIDLLLIINGKKYGFEYKFTGSPRITRSLQSAESLLKPERLFIVTPQSARYAISETIEVCSLADLQEIVGNYSSF